MPNHADSFFPQGLALGRNFCNRTAERERLKNNIESSRPTLIMSPRRYGKTSLVLYVLQSKKLPFSYIDLYSELNEVEVKNTILSSIGDILYSLESTPKKALTFVTEFFSDLSVSFRLVNTQINVEFSRPQKSSAKIILEGLKKLDDVLTSKNKKAVLFFDEFQRISQISESSTIEGAIRHIAQESKNIVFIFSGSSRNLLSNMFNDRTKPLYKLCDKISLERISEEDYIPFIKNKFQERWAKPISEDVIKAVLNVTERHSYYVNVLCHRLLRTKNLFTENEVAFAWHKYAVEEKTNVMNEVNLLSANQSKMLIAIAKYGNEVFPMSKGFMALTNFSSSSALQSVKSLEKMDYLYNDDEKKYVIVDPLIKYIFSSVGHNKFS